MSILSRVPVLISIFTIILISIFALESINSKHDIWIQVMHFFIHMIPSFILVVVLIFALKKEMTAGIIFLVIGGAASARLFLNNYYVAQSLYEKFIPPVVLALPFVIAGSVLVFNYFRKKKEEEKS